MLIKYKCKGERRKGIYKGNKRINMLCSKNEIRGPSPRANYTDRATAVKYAKLEDKKDLNKEKKKERNNVMTYYSGGIVTNGGLRRGVPCMHTYVRTEMRTHMHTCLQTYLPTYRYTKDIHQCKRALAPQVRGSLRKPRRPRNKIRAHDF
jgi:hypothetical protein